MKILITGCNGQLGRKMHDLLDSYDDEVVYTDVDSLDITDISALEKYVGVNGFTHIVNCAAYTAVDKAENDRITAAKINIDAVHNLAMVSSKHNIRLVHISTDYVFDGHSYQPYMENMIAMPQTVYGKTKFGGEQILQAECRTAVIIRTAWLYSEYGNNFVKTMLRLGREREELNVVYDQIGSPTYAGDLARVIVDILHHDEWIPGVYHFTDEGVCSWFDFAKMIFFIAGINCKVIPVLSSEYKCAAQRPFYSVLNKKKIKTTFGIDIPYWTESLQDCIFKLENDKI